MKGLVLETCSLGGFPNTQKTCSELTVLRNKLA